MATRKKAATFDIKNVLFAAAGGAAAGVHSGGASLSGGMHGVTAPVHGH